MFNYLERVEIKVSDDHFCASVTSYTTRSVSSEVEFDEPVSALTENELIELLRLCRKARKMYGAANKFNRD